MHALAALPADIEHVFIHDCARPLIRAEQLVALHKIDRREHAVVLAHRVTDTIKEHRDDARLRTLDRSRLWAMETPQVFARDLIAETEAIAAETAIPLQARIGIHTGPVVGGVIGTSRLAYDYWGDTMNVASRLQAAAPPNGIAVSEATYFRTRAEQDYEPHATLLKGIGEAQIYLARLA